MARQSKEQILEFLADLASPVSPEVFAGFGSEFLLNKYQWEKQNELMEKEEEYITHWVEQQPVIPTLDILLDIALHPPGADFYNGIAQRRQQDWEYFLAKLIYQLGIKDRAALVSRLEATEKQENPIIKTVKESLI
ncbi:hypothetical protein G7B40_033745 [Aetokthonos hydrillicola Thurmond2011]|jgi:hypothetical protein|uniref:Uncharacterized protein n=1 Tax=Aetokthonos hydrillicola Thurmond2011 TaxID=2712845 RepID=A0AAP5IDB2_9CYAN|nr:hypothetical protein [Aetokthonos hydrillicola]MBO3459715.1 hypothetical protein [Aetokthonos hydrillicola CCALA 1050]MBW4585147.1 hypothetical protein [Aetokthonos hydrillicola CCALA 1050]MDR9899486.1 hypothetical protein [Aetokthonos hydrillicola Thurmond2011]